MPGGKAELVSLVSDLGSLLKKKSGGGKQSDSAPAVDESLQTLQPAENKAVAMAPHVSVVLTVYKRTEYLKSALDSILNQTYTNFEILVADDSGTAVARDIVAAYGQPERIKYLPNEKTFGIADSLANAVNQAKG